MPLDQWLERALAHRTTRADPRVHALFESAQVAPELIEKHRWQSSHGPVIAYEVTLFVTAESIAIATSRHAVMDEVLAVLSAAVSADPGCALASVRLRWGRVARQAHDYRELDARELDGMSSDEVTRELATYFAALDSSAPWLTRASATFDGTALVIDGVAERDREAVRRALAPLAERVALR